MTQDELTLILRTEAQRIGSLAPGAIWHIFGSSLQTFERASDIDVLILCTSDGAAALIRHELGEACLRLPLHLFLLTREEEAELDFIASEGCIQIYPVT
jgi:predicted nucleotidyltransferase